MRLRRLKILIDSLILLFFSAFLVYFLVKLSLLFKKSELLGLIPITIASILFSYIFLVCLDLAEEKLR